MYFHLQTTYLCHTCKNTGSLLAVYVADPSKHRVNVCQSGLSFSAFSRKKVVSTQSTRIFLMLSTVVSCLMSTFFS